jgi:hypothetical protein
MYAAKDSINALVPSHAEFTVKIVDPCKARITPFLIQIAHEVGRNE